MRSIQGGGKIRFIRNEYQLHVSANFAKAIKLCEGDFIFLSDQDDIWHKDKVEKIVKWFAIHKDKDVVFTNENIIGSNDKLFVENTLFDVSGLNKRTLKWFDNGLAPEMFLFVCRAAGHTMALRNSFVSKIRVKASNHKVSDGAIYDEMIALCAIGYNKLGHMDEIVSCYRLHENNSEGLHGAEYSTFKNPNPYKSFKIDLSRYGELPQQLMERALFINKRYTFRYNDGFVHIFVNLAQYRQIYGKKAWKFILTDLTDWLEHFFQRIYNKLKKLI